MKLFKSFFIVGAMLFTIHVLADATAPAVIAPATVATVAAAPSGLSSLIQTHGGLQASALLMLLCLNTLMSALRDICARLDGVKPGDNSPTADAKLTLLNKVCLILGKILDYAGQNVQH